MSADLKLDHALTTYTASVLHECSFSVHLTAVSSQETKVVENQIMSRSDYSKEKDMSPQDHLASLTDYITGLPPVPVESFLVGHTLRIERDAVAALVATHQEQREYFFSWIRRYEH